MSSQKSKRTMMTNCLILYARKVGDEMKRLKDLTRRERRELNRIVRKQRRKKP